MPFKKIKKGWQYDPKGDHRIPTDPDVFTQERPPLRNQYGWPMKNKDEVDWERLNKEAEKKNNA